MPTKKKHAKPNYQAPKLTLDKLLATVQELNRVSADFLKVDVVTGLTFAGIALKTNDSVEKGRNQRSARRTYDQICKLANEVDVTGNDARILSRDLARLKSELQTLGETF